MRTLLTRLGLVGTLLVLAGCNTFPLLKGTTSTTPAVPTGKLPESAALVKYLNDNAALVQGVRSNNVAMDCKQGNQAVGLDGMLVCQKPRNFRLRAKLVGAPAVDIGSNSDEFWYWIKQANPPYVFHCSYRDLGTGKVDLPFPFQPDMVIAALGIAEYDPRGSYEVKMGPGGKYFELIESTQSAQGQPVQRVTVFNAMQVPRGQPQILAHVLRDPSGKIVCRAHIDQVTVDRGTGAVLPTLVRLEWPSQEMSMKMRMGDIQPVNIPGEQAARLFSRGDLSSFDAFDLARRGVDAPGGVRRAGTLPGVR